MSYSSATHIGRTRGSWVYTLYALAISLPLLVLPLQSEACTALHRKAAAGDLVIEPSAHSQEKTHVLEVGIALGYLRTTSRWRDLLRRIAHDGFRYVRVYEPWVRSRKDSISAVVSDLKILTDIGLVPMLSLSNYPFRFTPSENQKQEIIQTFPKAHRRKIGGKSVEYTNRYPPINLDAYLTFLESFLSRLEMTFGNEALRSWYFEIGNEPDAPLYFWGTSGEFRKVLYASLDLFKQHDPLYRVGGAGFTATLASGSKRKESYYELAREIAGDPAFDFLSFHVYDNVFKKSALAHRMGNNLVAEAKDKQIILSEWNLSYHKGYADKMINSAAFMEYLVKIATRAYEAKVDTLFVHKLVDRSANKKTGQLGMFDRAVRPKAGYRYLLEIKSIVESGYVAEQKGDVIILRSRDRVAVLNMGARRTIAFPGFDVVDAASNPQGETCTQLLAQGEWLILDRTEQESGSGVEQTTLTGNSLQ